MTELRPGVGIGVIIVKNGKVLLLKRKNAHGAGTWCFPGGHLEFNETFGECAKREVYEECNLKIRNIRFLGLTNDIFEMENKHYVTIFMLSDWESGETIIKEPNKSSDMGWFEWKNLPEPLFLPIENLIKQGYNNAI